MIVKILKKRKDQKLGSKTMSKLQQSFVLLFWVLTSFNASRSNYRPRLSLFLRAQSLLFSLSHDTGGLEKRTNVSWPRGRCSGASVWLLLARRKHNEGARIVFGKSTTEKRGRREVGRKREREGGEERGDWQTSLMRVSDENSPNSPAISALARVTS